MSAMLGDGGRSLDYLNTLLDDFVHPNTMYEEGNSRVVETPLSAAQSLHDMLFTSWSGVIRVFPGPPPAWRDVIVHNVATEGAFLLSAARRDGVTQFVHVKRLAGGPRARRAAARAAPP